VIQHGRGYNRFTPIQPRKLRAWIPRRGRFIVGIQPARHVILGHLEGVPIGADHKRGPLGFSFGYKF
ncbi:MAG: hypothetical protein RL429_543, partial [Bacteroidota bacterium]